MLPVLPLRPGARVPHTPPGVPVLRLGHRQVIIPPAAVEIRKIFIYFSIEKYFDISLYWLCHSVAHLRLVSGFLMFYTCSALEIVIP